MSETALWFGPSERPLFGWLHEPDVGSTAAVVLCPPLGLEAYNAHYPFRLLAEALEAAGLMTLRFDYDGTVDSAGSPLDPGRIEAWIASIEHAAELVRSRGADSVAIVGLRMGAVLAEFAAPRISDLGAMVLWDPCVSARAFVRQQRALERLRLTTEPNTTPYDGSPGGLISPETLDELKTLGAPPPREDSSTPVLVLHRPEDTMIDSLTSRLDPDHTEVIAVEGQRPFLDEPTLLRIVPAETIALISRWLTERLPPASDATEKPAPAGSPGERCGVVCPDSAYGPVSERVVELGDSGLFGIETRAEQADPSLPTLLFLNASKDGRTGPNRIWVRMARDWAALGYTGVRFDFSGLGDSAPRGGKERDIAGLPDAFDDVDDVVAAVSPDDPSNVILVGLCWGGYQALDSALTLTPRGVLAVNPQLAFPPAEMEAGGPIDPRRQIAVPTTPVSVNAYRKLLPESVRTFIRPVMWRLRRMWATSGTRKEWVNVLIEDGVDIYCICGKDDLHQLPNKAQQSLPAGASGGRHQVEVVENLQHALLPPSDQDRVTAMLQQHLLERFPPEPARGADEREASLVL
jgi:alpha/beta superfamily hydrolase